MRKNNEFEIRIRFDIIIAILMFFNHPHFDYVKCNKSSKVKNVNI